MERFPFQHGSGEKYIQSKYEWQFSVVANWVQAHTEGNAKHL